MILDNILLNTLVALGYFMLSVLNDDLNVQWHKAREKVLPIRGGNISLAMGVIAWLPYILFVTMFNWQIILADLAGNWVGSYFGIKRHADDDDDGLKELHARIEKLESEERTRDETI